jgi:hypothetical protein
MVLLNNSILLYFIFLLTQNLIYRMLFNVDTLILTDLSWNNGPHDK